MNQRLQIVLKFKISNQCDLFLSSVSVTAGYTLFGVRLSVVV